VSPNKPSALGTVREFQSEVDAIGEAAEPPWARVTVFVLTGLFVSIIALLFLTKIDRVVSSTAGKLVSTQRINVFQALDPSIIKSIDVHEGDEVKQGQLLATLDPTFAAADVKQLRLQVAGLQAQIERDQAQLNDRPFAFPESTDLEIRKTVAMQREYYNQQVAQYKAQLASYNAKISQTQATIQKYQIDASRYQQREQIAQQIENMHNTLVAQHAGSLLNALTSEDQRLEILRTLSSTTIAYSNRNIPWSQPRPTETRSFNNGLPN
jgi:hemolysin D